MSQLVVRNLDEEVKAGLQRLAAEHGRSMEEEVRSILREAVAAQRVTQQPAMGLGTQIAERFKECGLREGEELPTVRWEMKPVDFEE